MINIALLDDEAESLNNYAELMEQNGCQIIHFDNYDLFFESFEDDEIDLIISEWQVDDESVLEFAQKLRSTQAAMYLPLLILSSEESQDKITRALVNGVDDYLLKPVNFSLLIAKIKFFLREGHLFSNEFLMGRDYVFANRYKIVQPIGAGGSSTVYKAVDLRDDSHVALKVMKIPSISKDNFSSHFFVREVYLHSKFKNENVVQLIDFGYHDALCYMAMEYLKGQTLKDIVQDGEFSLGLAARVALAIVNVLEYFMEHDAVHRDIKPSNIILTDSGQIKLIDFGLCKGQYDCTVSNKSNINGTPQFVSPEQIVGGALDVRSDIYSLGITLYNLLTGRFPFYGDSLVATLSQHLSGVPEKIDSFRKDLPADVANTIHSMIYKEKRKRPRLSKIKEIFSKYVEEGATV